MTTTTTAGGPGTEPPGTVSPPSLVTHHHHHDRGAASTTTTTQVILPTTLIPGGASTTTTAVPSTSPLLSWAPISAADVGTAHTELRDVTFAGATEWAAGVYFDGSSDRTLVERWNGSSFSVVPSPNAVPGHNELDGIGGVDPSDIWAVGRYAAPSDPLTNPFGQEKSLIEHWDGRQWEIVTAPNEGKDHNELDSVSAASESSAWAVGLWDLHHTVSNRPLATYWDGFTWRVLPTTGTPLPLGAYGALSSVAAVPGAGWSWAVGSKIVHQVTETLIERCSSASCFIVPSPNEGVYHNELDGVSVVSPTDAWAVGYYYTGTVDHSLIEHWNGVSWTIVPSNDPLGAHYVLSSVAAVNASEVFAVGDYFDGVSDRTLVEQWNGLSWMVARSADDGSLHNDLYAVTASPTSGAVAVGLYYDGRTDRALALHAIP